MPKSKYSYLTLLFLLGDYAKAIDELEEGNMESALIGKDLVDLQSNPVNFDWFAPGLDKELIANEVQRMEDWLEKQDLKHFRKPRS